jgi:hypothetical protein
MISPHRVPIGTLALAATLIGFAAADGPPAAPSIRLRPEAGTNDLRRACFEVVGLGPKALEALTSNTIDEHHWREILAVWPDPGPILRDAPPSGPPLDGTYRVVGDLVRFTPRAPLEAGLRYRARLSPSRIGPEPGNPGGGGTIFAVFDVPVPKPEAPDLNGRDPHDTDLSGGRPQVALLMRARTPKDTESGAFT